MPSDRVPCPLCTKSVSRVNLGQHLLSKEHASDFATVKNVKILEAFYTSKVEQKGEMKQLPTLEFGKEEHRVCLGCKKCYAVKTLRKEGVTHFEKNPECEAAFKDALATLLGKENTTPADAPEDSNDTLEAELKALRLENRRLKEQLVRASEASPVTSSIPVEETEEYKELERDNEETFSKFKALRDVMKDLMGEKLNVKLDWSAQLFDIKEFVSKLKEPPVVEEAPKEAPKKEKSSNLKFLMSLPLGTEWNDKIDRAISSLSQEEAREYNQFMNSRHSKPAAPVVEPPKAPPFTSVQPVTENSIVGMAPVLKTTKMMAKQVGVRAGLTR